MYWLLLQKEFSSYEMLDQHFSICERTKTERFPFRLVTLGGHSTYLGEFTSLKQLRKRRDAIKTAFDTHKILKFDRE